jgi:uncharacterized membrane protein
LSLGREENKVAELIAIAYPDPDRAAHVLDTVKLLSDGRVIDVEDVVAISKDQEGRYKSDGGRRDIERGAVAGALIGTVIGLIFLAPAVGTLFGAASGAVGGSIADVGRIDDFVTEVGQQMPAGSSLLIMHVQGGDVERLLSEMSQHGGKLIRTTLPDDAEARIRVALGETAI